MTLRVVLAEDSYIVREGVLRLLASDPEIEIVAVCADLTELEAALASTDPDVVLTDIRMPPTGTDEGIRAADALREQRPDVGVVVLSQYDDPEYALALLRTGARGRAYLLKERLTDVSQLLSVIREVAAGGSYIDPRVVEALVAAKSGTEKTPFSSLTPREREVLTHMARGGNNAAIAHELVLTERAVEKHINSIFSKLGLTEERDVHRRVKAVLLFLSEPVRR